MSNIDDIFIIPDEEKALRAKRKAQLQARKEKNKELRSKIAKSRAIEKSEQKRTVKNNKNDIDDLKEQLRKLRESNTENNIKNIENNTEKNIEKSNNISVTPKKGPIKKIEILENKIEKIDYNDPNVKNAEKMIKNIDRKVEPQKEVINNVIKKHVFNKSLFKKRF